MPLRITILALCLAASTASAKEFSVAPSPSGGPVIGPALRSAAEGDTIRLARGVYRESIVIDKRVAIVGEAGATLDPSQPFRPAWEPAKGLGAGAYRAAVSDRPRTLMLDGQVLADIDEKRTEEESSPWFWKKVLSTGAPRSGYKFIRGAWIYRSGEKAVYVHVEGDADASKMNWSALFAVDAIVTFRNVDGASISGVTLAHGGSGVALLDGARHCTVSHCTIGPWDRAGVRLSNGAAENLVEGNEVFRGSYEDWTPVDDSKQRYEIWQIHKTAGFYDRVGISLVRAGVNNRVRGNHVYLTFDGIDLGDSSVESLDIPLKSPDDGRGTEIADNLIERTRDSGIELGVGCIDVRVHHNTLRQTHGGLRYKLPRIGPVFIYRNVLEGGSPFNIWYSMDDSPAEGYVYHNTIVGGRAALVYSSFNKPHGIGAPNWYYVNNLVVSERGFFGNWNTNAPANFTADYNVVAGGGKPWPDDPSKDQHSRYVQSIPLTKDLRPLPDCPAIDAGLDLSTYFHGKPLPGCEPGYFKGKAPDAGAFEVK
jgi:hypothetical protein